MPRPQRPTPPTASSLSPPNPPKPPSSARTDRCGPRAQVRCQNLPTQRRSPPDVLSLPHALNASLCRLFLFGGHATRRPSRPPEIGLPPRLLSSHSDSRLLVLQSVDSLRQPLIRWKSNRELFDDRRYAEGIFLGLIYRRYRYPYPNNETGDTTLLTPYPTLTLLLHPRQWLHLPHPPRPHLQQAPRPRRQQPQQEQQRRSPPPYYQ